MARRKRQYGSGSLFRKEVGGRSAGGSWRSRRDGRIKKRKCYESLGAISRGEAAEILRGKVGAGDGKRPTRSRVAFRTLADSGRPTCSQPSTSSRRRRIIDTS